LQFYDKCFGRDDLAKTIFDDLKASTEASVRCFLAQAGEGKSAFLAKCKAFFDEKKEKDDLVLFYPFRASDPVLNNPKHLYFYLLKQIDTSQTPNLSEPVATLRNLLQDAIRKWKNTNEGKKIYFLVDAIEEAWVKQGDHKSLPLLFEDGTVGMEHCRLLFTVRGKTNDGNPQPVAGQAIKGWFDRVTTPGILPPIAENDVREWIEGKLPGYLKEKGNECIDSLIDKVKDIDYYPLGVIKSG